MMNRSHDTGMPSSGADVNSAAEATAFVLTKKAFEHCPEFLKGMTDATCGGVVVFHGRVRAYNQGRHIVSILYDAYPGVCRTEGEKILQEAVERFGVRRARCYHRWGRLSVGDVAICVAVAGTHRRESFAAVQYIMDEVKRRLPIWKKETDVEGHSRWVEPVETLHADKPPSGGGLHNGFVPAEVKVDFGSDDFYRRQLNLPHIGPEGQKRLAGARVLVIGAGGLGCPAALSLVQAGVGVVGVCDDDTIAPDNLHRQGLYTAVDVGRPKADTAVMRLRAHNPFVTVRAHRLRVEPENILTLIRDYDVVIDGTDSLPTKFLINDACVLERKIMVQAAVHRFCGEAFVWHPANPSGCLRCRWPVIPPPSLFADCRAAGVLGAVPNIIGHMQAMWTVQCLLGRPIAACGHLVVFDFDTMQFRSLRRQRRDDCRVCGRHPEITSVETRHYSPMIVDDLETDPAAWLATDGAVWIDVREPDEQRQPSIEGLPRLIRRPFSRFDEWAGTLEAGTTYLLFCCAGVRSRKAAARLREKGHHRVYSISGGARRLQQALHDHAFPVA